MISMQTLEISVFPVNWLDIFGFDAIYVYDYSVYFFYEHCTNYVCMHTTI